MEQKKEVSGEAIAKSMFEMAKLKVPIIAIVIGEGSSGGALALGVANKVFMLENAIYSILSPEGFSSILWKDSSRYKEAAEKMKLTAKDLYKLNVIDKIIKEPNMKQEYETENKNNQENRNEEKNKEEAFEKTSQSLKKEIKSAIAEMNNKSKKEIVQDRYLKFRNMGEFIKI